MLSFLTRKLVYSTLYLCLFDVQYDDIVRKDFGHGVSWYVSPTIACQHCSFVRQGLSQYIPVICTSLFACVDYRELVSRRVYGLLIIANSWDYLITWSLEGALLVREVQWKWPMLVTFERMYGAENER